MYTVNKSEGKAWLQEDAWMNKPDETNYFGTEFFHEKYNKDLADYNKHLSSLKRIPIAHEYVDYWSEGEKVPDGGFTTEARTRIIAQNTWKDFVFAIPAKPKQDDEAVWDEVYSICLKHYHAYDYPEQAINELKSKYQITKVK